MAARRAERLVNLVICLLSTRQFLTASRIRDAVPGYEADDGNRITDEAFKRMFERDKAELRELGVPLETGRNSGFDAEDGYRIRRRDYELPPVEFDPAEAAAVGLAARLWQSATLGEPARQALIKLRAAGIDLQVADTPGALPRVDASDPALPALMDAARTATAVSFDYRKAGSEATQQRHLQPWGVLSWQRRWYVAGLDTVRDEPRSFRLSRIAGTVRRSGPPGAFDRPGDVDLLKMVTGRSPEQEQVAVIALAGPGGAQLRRLADDPGRAAAGDELRITFTDAGWLAGVIAGAGAAARVLDPPELRAAVTQRLRAVAGT